VREALEQRNWNEAAEQIKKASETIEKFGGEIGKATRLLKR
jgi:hypothetical protein